MYSLTRRVSNWDELKNCSAVLARFLLVHLKSLLYTEQSDSQHYRLYNDRPSLSRGREEDQSGNCKVSQQINNVLRWNMTWRKFQIYLNSVLLVDMIHRCAPSPSRESSSLAQFTINKIQHFLTPWGEVRRSAQHDEMFFILPSEWIFLVQRKKKSRPTALRPSAKL